MNGNVRGSYVLVVLTLFTLVVCGTAAAAKPKAASHHVARHPMHYAAPHGHLRASPDGDLVDEHGWRLRNGTWDNTCFNLIYLPSQFACSSNGGSAW